MSYFFAPIARGSKRFLCLLLLALVCGATTLATAQAPAPTAEVHTRGDLTGSWQGTLQAGKPLRVIVTFAKADRGFNGKLYSIDQSSQGFAVSDIGVDGSSVKFAVSVMSGTYVGSLSPDGNTMTGTITMGGGALPLVLVRATKETAWEIPAPKPPAKLMAADADPSFDVATIKPNDTGATAMQGLVINGRNFATKASSLADLISFSYEVQLKQIVGGPDWIFKDRYDIAAVPDVDGAPSPTQLRVMIRKLITERFKLTFHKDTREMPAFVLTVAKGGQKLTPTELQGSLPGLGVQPGVGGLKLVARNATVADFCQFLQIVVLDRPVVDQTGITGKYDINVTFSPDESMFNGRVPPLPRQDGVEPAPTFLEAMQQQLGVKVDAQKTAVGVIAVDHVEKPTAN